MKTKLIDEMVFDHKNNRWIFISDLKSGELIYKNKPIKEAQINFVNCNGITYVVSPNFKA